MKALQPQINEEDKELMEKRYQQGTLNTNI